MRTAWGLGGALVLLLVGVCAAVWGWTGGFDSSPPGAAASTGSRHPARALQSSPSGSETLGSEPSASDEAAPAEGAAEAAVPSEGGLPCTLGGRVADEEGRPVVGAVVQLLREEGGPLPLVLTDEQGEYRFAELLSGEFSLSVNSDAHLEQQLALRLIPGENLFDFTLKRAVLVSGMVVDEAGHPVADTNLMLMASPPGEDALDVGLSGEDGTFRLKAEQAGPYTVRLQNPDYLLTEQDVRAPAQRLRLVLRAGMDVLVEVMDEAGQPRMGASVLLQGGPSESVSLPSDTTNETGKALVKGLTPGRYQVLALVPAQGHLRTVRGAVEARAPGLTHVRLQLAPGLKLSGRVVDRAGKPVVGAEVRLAPLFLTEDSAQGEHAGDPTRELLEDAWMGGSGESLETGPDGRFTASGLEPGTYLVTASKQGYVFKGSTDEIDSVPGVRASTGGAEARLVLDFMGMVRGRVVNEDGKPITAFQVEDESFDSEQGLFQKAIEEPGEQEWTFLAEGMTGSRRKVRVREGEEVDLGTVVLRRGREVRVQVLDARTSQPVRGVEVDVLGTASGDGEPDSRLDLISTAPPPGTESTSEGGLERDFSTSIGGTLVLRHVEDQPLRLELTHPDYETASVPLGPRQDEVVVHLRLAAPSPAEALP